MRKKLVTLIATLIFVTSSLFSPLAKADPTREFMMLTTYGVLAGTLVGVASLAFTSQPGENLRNVAKGASLGLYAGILLGVYVVYVVPNQLASEQEEPSGEEKPEGEKTDQETYLKLMPVPIIGQNGIEGAGVLWQPLTF